MCAIGHGRMIAVGTGPAAPPLHLAGAGEVPKRFLRVEAHSAVEGAKGEGMARAGPAWPGQMHAEGADEHPAVRDAGLL